MRAWLWFRPRVHDKRHAAPQFSRESTPTTTQRVDTCRSLQTTPNNSNKPLNCRDPGTRHNRPQVSHSCRRLLSAIFLQSNVTSVRYLRTLAAIHNLSPWNASFHASYLSLEADVSFHTVSCMSQFLQTHCRRVRCIEKAHV